MTKRKAKNHGRNWLRPERRLALYLRDGLACAYCGAGVEEGVVLTLDHLQPYCQGGSNESSNLVTCCLRCNSSRGKRPWRAFAKAVAGYLNHGVTASDIVAHIRRSLRREVPLAQAKALIAARGGFTAALREARA